MVTKLLGIKSKTLKLKHLLMFCLIIGGHFIATAQFQNDLWTGKQANNWYFGINAGLNFETSPPTSLINGQTGLVTAYGWNAQTGEINFDNPRTGTTGSSSMSDSEGNLLFYTNGHTVWNIDHMVMSNGANLINSPHREQSTIIVPVPGDTQKYYIFSVKQQENSYQVPNPLLTPVHPFDNPLVVYSEIDMSLDNGLGAVTENKNIIISTESFYSDVTATYHEDGNQIWILFARSGDNTRFSTYLISEEGLNMTPIISDFGFSATPGMILETGQMKFSPDGTKIVKSVPSFVNQKVEVYEFNKETGEVTNLIVTLNQQDFVPDGEILGARGLEFSPNSKFLYTAGRFSGIVKQFNLEAGSAAEIKASGVVLSQSTTPPQFNNFLQAGPDGKIYVTYAPTWLGSGSEHHNLNVINYPNNQGVSSGFQTNAIDLISGVSLKDLPNFIQDYFESGILYDLACAGSNTTFSTIRIPGIASISWDFGNGETGDGLTPSYVYPVGGTYTVTATITSNGAQQTATTEITIQEGAEAFQSESIILCEDTPGTAVFDLTLQDSVILGSQDATFYELHYFESENEAASNENPILPADSYSAPTGTIIYARVTNLNTGCYAVTQFTLETVLQPQALAVDPITVCDTETLDGIATIDLTQRAADFQNGQPNTELSYFENQEDAEDNTDAIINPTNYTNIENPQTVYVRISTNNTQEACYAIAQLNLVVEELELINTSLELIGCSPFDLTNISLEIDNEFNLGYFENETDAQTSTNPIEDSQSYTPATESGIVYVRITDLNGCIQVAEMVLTAGDCKIPEGISPNGDGLNDRFDLSFISSKYGINHISIFNRYGTIIYEANSYNDEWYGQDKNGAILPTGTYYYVLKLNQPHPEYGYAIKKWVYLQKQ